MIERNNYKLENNGVRKDFHLYPRKISELKSEYKNNFNILLVTNEPNQGDYYCIPFAVVEHLFTDENRVNSEDHNGWGVVIKKGDILSFINTNYEKNISEYHSENINKLLKKDDEYYIENARAEINIRLKQSKFRKGVLENFGNKCAITGISETSLLVASHIVPWSKDRSKRGDIANGICLYVDIDALFDKGFISFSDNLEIITIDTTNLSKPLKEKIDALKGKKLNPTLKKDINKEYLKIHREEIFSKNRL